MDFRSLRVVVLDTSACIYFLDAPLTDPRRRAMSTLMRRAERGRAQIVLSPITVTELLVKPIRDSLVEAEAAVRLFVDELCEVRPLTTPDAITAATIRAEYGLATPDACIIACALGCEADALFGNDARWRRVPRIPYRHLDDLVVAR